MAGLTAIEGTRGGMFFYSYLYEANDDYTPLVRINHNTAANSIDYYHSEVNEQPLELTDRDGTIL